MEHDLVSVIIPTYNGARYILATVTSALMQTYSPVEIIVVDDGSEQDIKEVLEPVLGQVRYVRQPNRGPAAARNLGLRLSRGKYIAFLDHDDVWMPEKLTLSVELMKGNPDCGLVYSHHHLIDGSGTPVMKREPENTPSGRVLWHFAIMNRITTFSETLLLRSALEEVGYLNESAEILSADDYELWLRVAERYEVQYLPGSPLYYRVHDRNLFKQYYQNYTATVAIIKQFIARQSRKGGKESARLCRAARRNLYSQRRHFGYLLYYSKDRQRAGMLFRKLVISRPWAVRELVYLILCLLPHGALNCLKSFRQRIRAFACATSRPFPDPGPPRREAAEGAMERG